MSIEHKVRNKSEQGDEQKQKQSFTKWLFGHNRNYPLDKSKAFYRKRTPRAM